VAEYGKVKVFLSENDLFYRRTSLELLEGWVFGDFEDSFLRVYCVHKNGVGVPQADTKLSPVRVQGEFIDGFFLRNPTILLRASTTR